MTPFGAAAVVRIFVRTYGARGLARRGLHELRRKRDAFIRTPTARASGAAPQPGATYRPAFDGGTFPADRFAAARTRAQRVAAGEHEAYGFEWRRLAQGSEWSVHPHTGFRFPMVPWWKVPHLPPGSDIKDVWEPGRFGWVYDLVRGYVLTGEQRYADAFHRALASFAGANPPFQGVHWSCGQETAIRALALLHAEAVFPARAHEGSDGGNLLADVLAWSGERIADAIDYGTSQRNNHGISEAAGLIHLGIRFRGVHPDAGAWLSTGKRLIAEQVLDQVAPDGWYAQHSFTYMRVALDQALFAQLALQSAGDSLPREVLERLAASTVLLLSVVDGETGVVPNHGANDGARIAPISTAAYRDFRPVLTLASLVLGVPLPRDVPPDGEVVAWFGGRAPDTAPAREPGITRGDSGWAVARVGRASVFLRAGTYTHRPSHLDPLQLDVRFGSDEVVTDAGTYSYNGAGAWRNALSTALVHNGPVLDDSEPADRGPRFLWYSWPVAELVDATYADGTAVVVAEVPGRLRRVVTVCAGTVRVRDIVLDQAAKVVQVTWLLHPDAVAAHCIEVEDGEVIHATEGAIDAWFSPAYGQRLPTRAVRVRRSVADVAGGLTACITPPARRAADPAS